jgi:S-adenosylmethionine hydrolase
VAARLAAGLPLEQVGSPVPLDGLVRLPLRAPEVDEDHVHGEVAQVDHFGNLTLNVQAADLEAAGMHLGDDVELRVGGKTLRAPFRLTYGEVARGRLAVCEDAFRTITIAVNQGSAAVALRARRADPLVLARVAAPAVSALTPAGPA